VSVREFCRTAFDYVGLKAEDHVTVKQEFLRPAEVDRLMGDASKAKAKLKWRPVVTLEELIHEMIDADLDRVRKEKS
jgi:GDPmannose 4,6-dehydratase